MKKIWKYIPFVLLIILIGGICNVVFGENIIQYSTPQPKDVDVLVSRPSIGMELILNNNKIESIHMKINGEEVLAKYVENLQRIVYTPEKPLKSGDYQVDLSVSFEGWGQSIRQSWQFRVRENSLDQLGSPTEEQRAVLNYGNQYRKFMGLEELRPNNPLNTAAMAHSNYMAINKKNTHSEFINDKGFIGVMPYDRAEAFGYMGSYISENASSGQKDYEEAINGLIDAPYHRLAWLNPYMIDLGYGEKDKYYTFDFGGIKRGEDQVLVYPQENQKDVPNLWDGNEIPNPLRIYGKKGTVGYPISLSYFSKKNIVDVTVEKAILTNEKGQRVYTYLSTPSNDDQLKDSILIIPSQPLEKGKQYKISVKGKVLFEDKSGKAIDKTWSFTTFSSDEVVSPWEKELLYSDIGGHWGENVILDLGEKNIISPKIGKNFKPDDKITRAEFAEFIVKALGNKTKPYEGIFKDVLKDTNKAIYIEAAYREEIVAGTGSGNFEPNRYIKREEMAVMIIKAYEKKGNLEKIKDLPILTFSDRKEISSWALDYVRGTYGLGIIKGRGNNRFVPKDTATRAEGAVMVKGLMDAF